MRMSESQAETGLARGACKLGVSPSLAIYFKSHPSIVWVLVSPICSF